MTRFKIVDRYDNGFTLDPEAKETLFGLLTHPDFLKEVCQQAEVEQVEFTELMFQPTPYATNTPKGMPPEFEQYYDSPDYVIINVPPNLMFKAKIFKPSRLCAVYRKVA